MIFTLLLYFDIILGALVQVILKKGMNQQGIVDVKFTREAIFRMIKMYLNSIIIIGTLIYGFSIVLWTVVLSKIELSYAYPLASLNYPLVAFISTLVFKEKVPRMRWFAIAIIVIGVILVSLS